MAQHDPIDAQLRPSTLDAIIGQARIKSSLDVFLRAAQKRGEPIDHVLLRGGPGLGKTTFAVAIANAQDAELIIKIGPALDVKTIDMMIQTQLAPHPRVMRAMRRTQRAITLFIDEIHAVPNEALELLYPLMEDFQYEGRSVPKFTLIGATTDPAKLPPPFMDRFGINYFIDLYPEDELVEILTRSYRVLVSGKIDPEVAMDVAGRSRGTPRRANRLLARAIDYMQASNDKSLTLARVAESMQAIGVDRLGLEDTDRKILMVMADRFHARSVGVAAIASAIGEDVRTIERVYEPYLVRAGFINREIRGRTLTGPGKVVAGLALRGEVAY